MYESFSSLVKLCVCVCDLVRKSVKLLTVLKENSAVLEKGSSGLDFGENSGL